MKRFITLLSGLFLAALIGLAQGKWEQVSITPYGTGGINRSGERIDNSYSAGKFNSEVKSTSKNNPYVYFRKAQFSVPGKTFRPGETFTVSMNLTVKRHSGNGTPKGNAGAVIVNGKAGQGTSVPTQVSVSGKDAAKSGSVTLSVPSHSAAGNNFSIVYSCFDIKVVYLYRWAEDKPAAAEQPARIEEIPVVADELVMPDDTILPPADSVAFEEEPVFDFPDVDSLALLEEQGIDPFAEEPQPEEATVEEKVKKAPKASDSDIFLSIFGFDLTKKDTILYGIIAGLGLLLLILLLVLIFRKNPAKKAAKEEAKKAAAEAKAAARAEAAEKTAAMKAEREAKLAEQKAAAAEKAAAAKAERESKLAEQKAAQEAKRAELKAAQEAKAAELKAKKEAAAAAAAAKAAEQKARAAEKPVEKPAEKPAEEPKPAGKRFCENCGAPLDADAVFCENCGTKVE